VGGTCRCSEVFAASRRVSQRSDGVFLMEDSGSSFTTNRRTVSCRGFVPQLALNHNADHFHVHIVNANFTGLPGQSVGQAHMLDDIIAWVRSDSMHSAIPLTVLQLEFDPEIFTKITLSYSLGERHGLREPMVAAQKTLPDD
jgi:hypothetical protein